MEDLTTSYIVDNIDCFDTRDIDAILRTINTKKLRRESYEVETVSTPKYRYEVYDLGFIDYSLLESTDFAKLLAECNRMMIAKWGSFDDYMMYRKHSMTLERFWVRGDFTFETTDKYGTPADFEFLVTDILGLPPSQLERVWGMGDSWTVTTQYMTITRYKNGKIKFKGLTPKQWKVVFDKIQYFHTCKRKTV